MKPLYIFDLDGTLALIEHRRHFVEGPTKDWRGFFAACVYDVPNQPVIRTLQSLRKSGAEIWIWSGRSDEVRAQTVEWLCKDSTKSRSGLPQYLVAFRKDGENTEPVAHINGLEYFVGENEPSHGNLSHERWRRYASPIWSDINFSNTLNAKAAREADDERHVCPMALDLIERAIHLWSNPGDVIFDPYSGIGSTGYMAIKTGRKFVGSELKTAYFKQAAKNIGQARESHGSLFDCEAA